MPQTQANIPTELDAALEYARIGVPVFPCNPLDKKPLTPNGFKDATRDEAQIRAWWGRWPNAMIGAPMGPASNLWAVDLDLDPARKIDGKATLDQLVAQRGALPPTLMTITPRGGRHLIFSWEISHDIRNSASRIGPGIDVRGNGGYVCLPPSRSANGGEYRWDPDSAPQSVPAPGWLIALAKRKIKAWARAALEYECKAVTSAQPGTRNAQLNTAAFNLFQIVAGGELDEDEVRDALFEAAVTCQLVADDGAAAVEATINSGAQAGAQQPRTRPQPRTRTGPRPIIRIIAGQLPRIINETEDALAASGLPIFSRAGSLTEPTSETMLAASGRKTVVAQLHTFNSDSFLKPIAESATFQKFNAKRNDWVEIDPPLQLVRTVLANPRYWKFPRVSGIITTPTLRPDGSLLDDAGYDLETELFLLPGFQLPPIPQHPTKDQAQAALATLIDLLSEFTFKGMGSEPERHLNRSVALSGLLTALVRGSLPTAPMHLVRAHAPGTGKSYLVDIAAVIATGRLCPVITALRSTEETEKRLGSVILSGLAIISLDNCSHDLGGELLCQIAERPVIRIRVLGRSAIPECECHTAVFATGNNITFKGDMVRRGVVCNLEARDERPELRAFRRDTLRQAAANRETYVAAALTIMRAYLAAGAPSVCGPFGSYAEWSTMVRSPLVWLDEPDPVASVDATLIEDPELAELREWFVLWLAEFKLDEPYTSAGFAEAARAAPIGFNPNPLKEFLLRVAGDKNGDISTKRLGEWLHRNCGRVARVERPNGSASRYWMIKGRLRTNATTFQLSEVT
jgi:Bifunctional DNA primase/polymerase, N-terminal